LNNDIVFEDSCYNSPALFSLQDSTGLSGVRWDFGDPNTGLNNTSTIFSPSHTFSDSGAYSVRAIVQINCREDTLFKTIVITNCDTSDCKISIPNAFTPNNDGANDTFQPISKCPLEEYVCTIYNRWGELIFQTINPKEPWDGKKFGLECTSDVYVYVITCKTATVPLKTYTDEVTLVR
jgi:gliding motility-associated-like protein